MARISLRAYQRDIEELVETHQFDQAIAHCRHILKYYPKDVNTYRLLGKAYLESQRYGDASDIFLRVLSSVPDDFVSHVGMSIIREDEGNLDEAIWHMERAFESQPANSAIQGELRRLHGKREGIEPPKIRLTRGALARMYLKGELYAQAIAELRAGLHEDLKRHDLQVVLAQAYYLVGQRVDAAEVCSTLLKSLPYCLEANRILADILSHSERADESQVYAKRVQTLDPYAAHISPAATTQDKVPDSAVLLEKLEWRPGLQVTEATLQPEWATSLGVDLGTVVAGADGVPDWLASSEVKPVQGETKSAKPFVDATPTPNEEAPLEDIGIPDWMKEAGWIESTEATDESGFYPLSETDVAEGDLAPAEIPEWLKTMAPTTTDNILPTVSAEPTAIATGEDAQAGVTPWLEESPPGPTDSVAMWLETQVPPSSLDEQLDLGTSNLEKIPDWLQDLGKPSVAESATLPEPPQDHQAKESPPAGLGEEDESWIETAATATAAAVLIGAIKTPEDAFEELPVEVKEDLHSETALAEETSDWMRGLEPVVADNIISTASQGSPPEEGIEPLAEPVAEEELPEWLQNLEPMVEEQPSQPVEVEETLPEAASDSSTLEEQIVRAAAVTGLEAEAGDWIVEMGEEEVTQQVSAGSEAAITTPRDAQSLDDEEAFAWLENLAARQGVEEALLLSPDERRETPPEWVLTEATQDETQDKLEEITEVTGELETIVLDIPADMVQAEEISETAAPEQIDVIGSAVETTWPELEMEASELSQDKSEAGAEPEREVMNLRTDSTITGEIIEQLPADGLDIESPAETSAHEAEVLESGLGGMTVGAVALSAPSEVEAGLDDGMLFYPIEAAQSGEERLSLDEGPVAKEDTKPTTIKAAIPLVVVATASEFISPISDADTEEAGVVTGVMASKAEVVEEQPQPPEEGLEISQVIPLAPEESIMENAPSDEIPEWISQIEHVEPSIPDEDGVVIPSAVEPPIAEGVTIPEEDEAFAWLEGLAARQGAEEALLLSPDERRESPPEWVQQEVAVAGEDEFPSDQPIDDTSLPEWLQEAPKAAEEEEPPVEIETSIPDWLKQPAAIIQETDEAKEIPPLAPELPGWLAGIDEAQKDQEATDWALTEEGLKEAEPAIVEEITVSRSQVIPLEEYKPTLDLNHAGLVDLERLPGIGFIKAQAILDYRDAHGSFHDVEELQLVTGITPEMLVELKQHLMVATPEAPNVMELPVEDHQVLMVQARNALVQGEIPLALSRYGILINKNQMLPDVIVDLNEALYRFPIDVPIWEALGDAHMHAGHLQEALNAYTKAEEYLH